MKDLGSVSSKSDRWSGAAGVVAVAAFVASSMLLRHTPSTDQPTADIIDWFTDHRTTGLVAVYLLGLGTTAFLFFAAGLRRRLHADDESEAAANAAFAGGIAFAVMLFLEGAAVAVLAFRPETAAAVARALYDLNALLVAFAAFPAAVLVGGASLAIVTSHVLPRWLAWTGLGITLLQFVGAAAYQQSGAFMPPGDAGFLQAAVATFVLWVLATSVTLLRVRSPVREKQSPPLSGTS